MSARFLTTSEMKFTNKKRIKSSVHYNNITETVYNCKNIIK